MKNTFKTVLLAAALSVASVASADSYLYWMVSETPDKFGDWDYARIQVQKNGEKIGSFLTFGDTGLSEIGTDGDNSISANYANLGNFVNNGSDTYAYILELYSDSTGWVAENTKAITYAALLTSDAIYTGGGSGTSVYNFNTGKDDDFTNVPEPTSGLLVALGCALMGLRRRRA